MADLAVAHDHGLVVMSAVLALTAGFTGLSLTRGMQSRTIVQKKVAVALAAMALGGGIWAMHFVAMLGMRLPIPFHYDAAITLVSALMAILIVGLALILLHFVSRSPRTITAAGAIVGCGVLAMHYVGMAGLQLARPVNAPLAVAGSSAVAVGLCTAAIWAAYGRRSDRNIALGTVCFAAAVVAVHYLAIAGTEFVEDAGGAEFGPRMTNEVLAIGVIATSFLLLGAFLWVGVTWLVPAAADASPAEPPPDPAPGPKQDAAQPRPLRVPCERDGGKVFVAPAEIAFVRADGHYTQVYTPSDRLFCAWSVTEAARRLLPAGFLHTHRSYLVNPAHVAGFERSKEKGRCLFAEDGLPPAPVSRSKLRTVQEALAAPGGAVRAG